MQLFVRSTHGKVAVLDIDEDSSVAGLQAQIQLRMGVPPENQRLTHAGTTLEPGALLGASGVRNEASIELLVSGRGGSSEARVPDLSGAPPRRSQQSATYSDFFVPLIASAWEQTPGAGIPGLRVDGQQWGPKCGK